MLTRLLPDQVSKFWDIIKYAVENSLPPVAGDHPDKMNRVLAAALADRVQVWASYARNGDNVKFEGVALTRLLYDDVSDTRNLLIYCIFGYTSVDKASWLHALEALVKYAKSEKCLQVIAYTQLPYVVEKARNLGANSAYHFVSFDVDKIIQNLNELTWR